MNTLRTLLVFLCLFALSCDKKDQEEGNRICFFQEFEPAIMVEDSESYAIYFDDDGVDDITFTSNPVEFGIKATTSDNVNFAYGTEQFSGSDILIFKGDEISPSLSWKKAMPLAGKIDDFSNTYPIYYLGIRKRIGEYVYNGWIDVYKTDETFRLEKVYFYKNDDAPVHAGTQNENCNLN